MRIFRTSNRILFSSGYGAVPKWLRERSAKPLCNGSNPFGASNLPLIAFNLPILRREKNFVSATAYELYVKPIVSALGVLLVGALIV